MSSLRHNGYLDAARRCLLDVGWRRTTLTDVARRAGVSRMTLYRAFPDMDALLGDLMAREWAAVVAEVTDAGPAAHQGSPDDARGLAESVVAVTRALRANDLFRRILDVDPELLLPYLLERPGRSQKAILTVLADRIAAAQAAGTVRPGDPELLARTVVLAAHGLTLSARTMTGPGIGYDDLDAGLTDLLAGGLAP